LFSFKRHGWLVFGLIVFLLVQILFSVNPEAKESYKIFFNIAFFWIFLPVMIFVLLYKEMKEQYEYKDISNLIENKKWFSVIKAYFEISFSFIGIIIGFVIIYLVWRYFFN